MTEYILTTNQLTKRFKQKVVLNHINLKIPQGKIYGLLGINGAGKSTTMKIITGIITDFEGGMEFKHQPWHRSILQQIGSLIEYPAAYGNLTAFDNMKIIALEDHLPLEKIPVILARLNIDNTGNKKVKNFSLGMKQRLGIAMAMLKNPDFLILDEPFNGLDPYGIKELKTYLKELTQTGKTVLISSHILPELQDIAEFIGILNNGSLVYQQAVTGKEDLNQIFFEKTQG
ncbi:ATP-binding cassette domain-containing protein [Fructilactobacillus carniphilus]|uniref:ATP-binding cassette domain-containing protein n=1 Tax=Fructilactobacillus carniphilus TaxID=2940297 RepID=A0ABY5BUT9_9LACO|nr:ATP-binding cassette domain-containing protein [Fructilactobacillus carniphilus]USS90260.1 ATP-binding cassette domain-containing protein [Fructilactobacillus carniphilus]